MIQNYILYFIFFIHLHFDIHSATKISNPMRILFTFSVLLFSILMQAQTSYSDDFESYSANAYIAASNPAWKTWTNKPGTTEDVRISTEQAKSGVNSLKLFSTAASGGPADVVLPFGQRYTSGNFTYKMSMYVPAEKTAYFNFQATATIGQTWAMDANFNQNGDMILSSGSTILMNAKYPADEWFEIEFDINLSANVWKVKMNSACIGSFSNTTNSVASINLYPSNINALFYVDDVSYFYTSTAPKLSLDGGISSLVWSKAKLAGTKDTPEFTFKNFGDSTINSIELSIADGDLVLPFSIKDLNIKKGQTVKLKLPEITLQEGDNLIYITLEKINENNSDDEPCNNNITFVLTAVKPAEFRAVLVEEGTGPWCQWCPRGAVFMDRYAHNYEKLFIPIAVHNGNTNPMRITQYDSFMAFPAYPNCKVNRSLVVDPSVTENPFLREIVKPAQVKIETGAEYNATTSELLVSTNIEFLEDISGAFNVNLVLTEDGVTGTSAAYNQANAYAGGGSGVMGGYESLPNPVPASMMVYDHVARAIAGINPMPNTSFNGSYAKGDKVLLNFIFTLNNGWNTKNMHIIPIVLQNSEYINAATSTFDEAIATGFTVNTQNTLLSSEEIIIFPNPADDILNIDINLNSASQVDVVLRQITGQTITQRSFGNLDGHHILTLPINIMNPGIYLIEINTNQGTRIEKVVVK